MDLDVTQEGRVTVVAVSGDLVIGDAENEFKKAIAGLLERGEVFLLIDCTRLGIVDSTGLGALVRALTTAQNEGGQTKLSNVGTQLRRLLEMTKLDSVFEIYKDRQEAIASF
jgi:anti-sigma B factor antagonist